MEQITAYPVGYGAEEETSFKELHGGGVEHAALSHMFATYRRRPGAQQSYGKPNTGKFDSTGGAEYVDGNHFELCTPEYSNVDELVTRLQAHEGVLIDFATATLRRFPKIEGLGVNRRNVDSEGNSFACHDNFAFVTDGPPDEAYERLRPTLAGHQLTRQFVSGAGNIGFRGATFAQKSPTVKDTYGYGYSSTLSRFIANTEGTPRIEVRDSDTNISPAAGRLRIGGAAMAIAIGRTPLRRHFAWFTDTIGSAPGSTPSKLAQAASQLYITPDGVLHPTKALVNAHRYQTLLAEVFLSDEMRRCGGAPPDFLVDIARDQLDYCGVMDRVMKGELPFSALADVSDWAARMDMVIRRINRDRAKGVQREIGDEISLRDSLAYDFIQISRTPDKQIKVQKFGGYAARDRLHQFRHERTLEEVEYARTHAPEDTRAHVRAELIANYEVGSATWARVVLRHRRDSRGSVVIELTDVRTDKLSLLNERQLRNAMPRAA